MKQRTLLITLVAMLLSIGAFAQEGESFEPSGKPILRIYTNYHSTFTGSEYDKMFEIQRAYFGYQHQFSKNFSGQLILDVGDPKSGDLKMTAYLKNAYLQYKNDRLTAQIGLIGLYQFKMQEDLWGNRYFFKSFMDEYKFGHSADLGAFIKYKIHDAISVDLTIANGEGYKKVEADSIFKYSGGVTITPLKGLDIRASYDYMGMDMPQQTLAFYMGYSVENIRLGAEYNFQINNKMTADNDLSGLSFYGSYQMEKVRFIGRYDKLSSPILSGDTDPWNFGKDGQLFIAGAEFNPVKGIKITPNYQGWKPADGSEMINSAYLSIEIRF